MSKPYMQMWGQERQSFIDRHCFYIEQTQKKLLSPFNKIEEEADQYAEDTFKKLSQDSNFNSYQIYDFVHNEKIDFHMMLEDIYSQTLLNVISGMYFEWDKTLRSWILKEVEEWCKKSGKNIKNAIWNASFEELIDFLNCWNVSIQNQKFFKDLDICRLIVNVYKHGYGKSFDKLKSDYPKYLQQNDTNDIIFEYADYTDLYVTNKDIEVFSNAILDFWKYIPKDNWLNSNQAVPNWFGKAYNKDQES